MGPQALPADKMAFSFAWIQTRRSPSGEKALEFPTPLRGVPIAAAFISETHSRTSFGSTITIHPPAQFRMNILFWMVSRADFQTVRRWTLKVFFGTDRKSTRLNSSHI